MLEYGMAKYSRGNWKKGFKVTEVIDSLSRHLAKLAAGEDIDQESGETHTGHIVVNALFLAEMMRRSECDDRSPKPAQADLFGITLPQQWYEAPYA